jgi:VanZ family protein
VLALAATAVLLLLPGDLLSAACDWLAPWWPLPSPERAPAILPLDKLVHAGLFAVCGLLVLLGWLTCSGHWLRLFLLLLLFAAFTEAAQYPIPGRTADVADLLADAAGAATGIWWGLRRLR